MSEPRRCELSELGTIWPASILREAVADGLPLVCDRLPNSETVIPDLAAYWLAGYTASQQGSASRGNTEASGPYGPVAFALAAASPMALPSSERLDALTEWFGECGHHVSREAILDAVISVRQRLDEQLH